jgi:hypothetical protein
LHDFLDGGLYGNIKTINHKSLEKKRRIVTIAFTSMQKSIFGLLDNCCTEVEKETASYTLTYNCARVIRNWSKVIEQVPHQWPRGELFCYLLDLREVLKLVDAASKGALAEKNMEKFLSKNSDVHAGVFLPSSPEFHFPEGMWENAFPYIAEIWRCLKILLQEFATPSYAWAIALRINIRKLIGSTGVTIINLENIMYGYLRDEVSNHYLGTLGVIDFKFTATRLFQCIGQKTGMDTTIQSLNQLLSRKDVATKMFSEEAMLDFANIRDSIQQSMTKSKVGTVQKKSSKESRRLDEANTMSSLPSATASSTADESSRAESSPPDCSETHREDRP